MPRVTQYGKLNLTPPDATFLNARPRAPWSLYLSNPNPSRGMMPNIWHSKSGSFRDIRRHSFPLSLCHSGEFTQCFRESVPLLRSTPTAKRKRTIFTDKYLGPPHCPPFTGILSSLAAFSCFCMTEIQVMGTEIQARWEAVAFAQKKSKLDSQKRRKNKPQFCY